MRRAQTATVITLLITTVLITPEAARAEGLERSRVGRWARAAAPVARDDGPTPIVPRFQGPWEQGTFDPGQEIWGLALVATGAIVGGLGLYALETDPVECAAPCAEGARMSGRTELGTGLLVGGVFIAGVGLYLIATAGPRTPRIVTTALRLPVSVELTEEGGVLASSVTF